MSISDWFRSRNNPDSQPVAMNTTQEPIPPETGQLSDGWDFESSLPLRTLAALYLTHGWMWAHTRGVPTLDQLKAFIGIQVAHIDNIVDANYSNTGRLLFMKDEEFPGSVDVYLHVGTAYDNNNDSDCEGTLVD